MYICVLVLTLEKKGHQVVIFQEHYPPPKKKVKFKKKKNYPKKTIFCFVRKINTFVKKKNFFFKKGTVVSCTPKIL